MPRKKKEISKREKVFNVISNAIDFVQEKWRTLIWGGFTLFCISLFIYVVFFWIDTVSEIKFEIINVHDALVRGMDLLHTEDFKNESRNGRVYQARTPVTTVYERSKERVLFWAERDANPFFHFMEGLWMLDGRNDLEFVKHFAKSMENYSDDGKSL